MLIDSELALWQEYENEGWPARYLFDGRARLFDYHYGEGAYEETELAIQELLGVAREPLAPLRAGRPQAALLPPTPDREGAYSGPYRRAVCGRRSRATGSVTVRGGEQGDVRELAISHPGAYQLIEHPRHTAGVLELEIGPGVSCLATCFAPGLA